MSLPEVLVAQTLTAQAFAPFGQVIDAESLDAITINAGSAQRINSPVEIEASHGHAGVSIFLGQPHGFPVDLIEMERHPLGSQTFMPLDNRPYLVVVAINGPDDLPQQPRAFLASGRQGVSYPPGQWHHPLLSLVDVSRFLVIDRVGPGQNLDVVAYKLPIRVVAPDGA